MGDNTVDLDPDTLRAAIQACLQMGPMRTTDPYLYHEFGFNCDLTTVSDTDKQEVIKVFGIMRDIAEEMARRGETAENFLSDD